MQLDEYEDAALVTMAPPGRFVSDELALATWALGLTGEAGEAADHIKKHIGHGHALDRDKIAKELGDVLWYIAAMARQLGFRLDEIASMNIDKLRKRYPDGFTCEASINRKA